MRRDNRLCCDRSVISEHGTPKGVHNVADAGYKHATPNGVEEAYAPPPNKRFATARR